MTAAASDPLELGLAAVDLKKPDDDDQRLWSITTIISVLDKPALIYWSAEQTAKAAVEHVDAWRAIQESSGTDEAVKWLAGARFRTPKGKRTAAQLGTDVHALCEEYALTGVRPDTDDETRPFLDQFDRWLDRAQPSFQATEVVVYHPRFGYAGQADVFLTVDGWRANVDYKTSAKSFDKQGKPTGPYPEVALQLAAARWAEMAAVWRPRRFESFRRRYYALSRAEIDMAVAVPEVDGSACLHITPEHCELYPVRTDEDVFERFLFVLEAARWVLQDAQTVLGDPVVFPERPPRALVPVPDLPMNGQNTAWKDEQ